MLDFLYVIAISNLLTEQTIGVRLVMLLLDKIGVKRENYIQISGWKKWLAEILTCWNCLTVWVGILWWLIIGGNLLELTILPLLIVDVIQKIKR
jgi:hypothetical protein